MIVDVLIQVSLPIISVSTTYLIARRRLSGIVMALASQPLWIVTAVLHRQWGIVVTATLNVWSLATGVRRWRAEQSDSSAAGHRLSATFRRQARRLLRRTTTARSISPTPSPAPEAMAPEGGVR